MQLKGNKLKQNSKNTQLTQKKATLRSSNHQNGAAPAGKRRTDQRPGLPVQKQTLVRGHTSVDKGAKVTRRSKEGPCNKGCWETGKPHAEE